MPITVYEPIQRLQKLARKTHRAYLLSLRAGIDQDKKKLRKAICVDGAYQYSLVAYSSLLSGRLSLGPIVVVVVTDGL
jgi:hypothetical protein